MVPQKENNVLGNVHRSQLAVVMKATGLRKCLGKEFLPSGADIAAY